MNIEQAKEILKNKSYYDNTIDEIDKALDIAIKSFDMWDKVIEHIKQTYDIMCNCDCVGKNCDKECFEADNIQAVECIQIIKKYKKEIEE